MAVTARSATWPWAGDKPVHLPRPAEVPQDFLVPGDPARVDLAACVLDGFKIVGQNREFRMGVGRFRGFPVGICSTGIGGPSTEIAMVELAAIGARRIVRIGGMGGLAEDLGLGHFLCVEGTPANSASARPYAVGGAIHSCPALVAALDAERAARSLPGRRGRVVTVDGYYRAQGRADRVDGAPHPQALKELAALGADGIEMEAETVLAVGAALGIQAAAFLSVHGHRATDGWLDDYEEAQRNLISVAAGALATLATP